MQEFLIFVIRGLTDYPDEVRVDFVESEGSQTYELWLHPDDMGRVIGKQGNTINAVRALLQVGSAKQNIRSTLKVRDSAVEEGEEEDV